MFITEDYEPHLGRTKEEVGRLIPEVATGSPTTSVVYLPRTTRALPLYGATGLVERS